MKPHAPVGPSIGYAVDAFVGRTDVLNVLNARFAAAAAGHGSVVLLAGEAGIGKTRTAEEFCRFALAEDAEVLVGRCYEGSGAPPFWPWIQILQTYAGSRDVATLRRELDTAAADVATIDEGLRTRLDLPPPPIVEPEQARFRVFDGVTRALVRAAAVKPLVLVLEDLHGADKPSLLLLQFLARALREARVLVVGTFRDVALSPAHPLGETLSELGRERVGEKLDLRGLTEHDVELLLTQLARTPVAPAVAAAVHARTAGNPLYVTEIARALLATAEPDTLEPEHARTLDVPETVRLAIRRRLAPLLPRCRDVLTLAALFGREFGLRVLAWAIGDEVADVLAFLDQARAIGIVGVVPADPDRFMFAHGLIGETLVQDLGPSALVALHTRAAVALARHPRAEQHAAEVVHHWFSAGPAGDPSQAFAWAMRAGTRAMRALAYEEAERLYRMALTALEWKDAADPRDEAEVCLALGEALKRSGDGEGAKELFSRGADLARQLGSPELLTRAALGFAPHLTYATQPEPDARVIRLLEDAIASWRGQDSGLHARALARKALAIIFRDPELVMSFANGGLAMARRVGDAATLRGVLVTWLMTHQRERHLRLRHASELVALAEEAVDIEALAEGRLARAVGLFEHGDVDAMRVEIEGLSRLVAELRQPIWSWRARVIETSRAMLDGRLQEAEAMARGALAIGQECLPYAAPAYFVGQMMMIGLLMGDPEPYASQYRTFFEAHPMAMASAPLAWVEAELGKLDAVRALLERLTADDFSAVIADIVAPIGHTFIAEGCVAVGDQVRSARMYDLLIAEQLSWIMWADGVPIGPISLQLGMLARTLGRLDDAVGHLDDAIATCARAGAWPFLARTQLEYALTLRRRGAPGDAERAESLLVEARAAAERLDMRGLTAKILAAMSCGTGGETLRAAVLPEPAANHFRSEGALLEEARLLRGRRDGAQPMPPPIRESGDAFRREGEYWSLVFGEQTARLRDTKGLSYIAFLLAHPGLEVHVADLVRLGADYDAPPTTGNDLGAFLDPRARAEYQQRLRDLRDQIEEAVREGDIGRAAAARRETEELTEALMAAYGLGGRARRAGDPAERMRKAVRIQIRRALQRIHVAHPALGRHLTNALRTGIFCSYRPERPVPWQV